MNRPAPACPLRHAGAFFGATARIWCDGILAVDRDGAILAPGLFDATRKFYSRDAFAPAPKEAVITVPSQYRTHSLPFAAALLLAVTALLGATACDRSSPSNDEQPKQATSEQPATESNEADSPDPDQTRTGPSANGHYFVVVSPEPNPIPFQKLFALNIQIYESDARETPAKEIKIDQLRARMPAHDHGMKTEPDVTRQAPGTFRVEGMRFHMRGEGEDGRWVLEMVLNGEKGIDDVEFEYQCCVAQ